MEGHEDRLSNDDLIGFAEQEETSSLVSGATSTRLIQRRPHLWARTRRPSLSQGYYPEWEQDNVEWTDEKHSLYLKSMEASFVNQLYNLKDLFGFDEKWCRQGSPSGSGQIKVQQHCHWPKEIPKISPQPEVNDGSEECSDQNFINEDCEKRAPKRQRSKRLRTLGTSAEINNDQAVPFGLLCMPIQDRNEGCSGMKDITIEQGGQATKTGSAF